MKVQMSKLKLLLAGASFAVIAACSQGSDIASPGPSAPGTPPGGGGNGGGGNGGTVSCPTGFTQTGSVGDFTACEVSGQILSNLTLEAVDGVAYRINGRIDVGADIGADGNKAGGQSARLTIEPGAVVYGASGADYIVVNRGSQIEALGTATQPVIMTSQADIERRAADADDLGGSNTAEWGGLVLLGQAPINRCLSAAAAPGTVACENIVEGVTNPDAIYGGDDANDNSGILRYLQIRFAGFAINTAGNELNGITFAGIGAGTEVNHVQVHNNEDDGVEFFGGNVNVSHLVLTGNKDDSIDTDNGYQGNIQFAIVVQNPDIGDNIVEASSVAPGALPASDATISNFTFVGNRTNAFRLNTGTVGTYVNGVVDYGKECFRWQDSAGDGNTSFNAATDPSFRSVLFDCDAGVATSNSVAGVPDAAIAADSNNLLGSNSLASRLFPGPVEQGVTPVDPTTLGSFFQSASYAGAFSASETETSNWASGWTFGLFPEAACPTGTADTGLELNGETICRVSGVLTDDLRLTRGNVYEISGRVDVGIDVGADGSAAGGDTAVLTIESGVTLFGDSGADYIVVNRGSQIFANGTRENPVILTSENDLTGNQVDPDTATAEWGGLVLLGQAPINRCLSSSATPGTAACENIVEGVTNPDARYGGADADDNSGALRFVQLKYAGFAINTAGNELNGITFGGIGRGTTVEYVQVHNNEDDGVEFFGGNVNVRHLVLTGNKDDSIDTDNGYQGNIQFAIVVQNADLGDNIVEASSAGNGVTPLSNATISNFTFIGNRTNAFRLNTGTVGRYLNGVVDYGKECFRFQDSAGDGVAGYSLANDPRFDSVLFDCDGGLATSNSDAAAAQGAVDQGSNNTTAVASSLTGVFVNGTAETAATVFDANALDSWFEPVTYIGAVENGSDRWWAGWSCGLEASSPC
jgi:uncharacterized membrane protein